MTDKVDKVDKVISSVTLAGSLLSCAATTCVLVSFAIYRRHLSNFRHVLVLNLMVAGMHYCLFLSPSSTY